MITDSTELYNFFQLIVLVFQPTTLLFWFRLTALIAPFSMKNLLSTKQQIYEVSFKVVNKVEHLAARKPDTSLNRWRPKKS